MAIEKSLYEAPQGLESLAAEPDIEIEVVDPEEVNIAMDGIEIHMGKIGRAHV